LDTSHTQEARINEHRMPTGTCTNRITFFMRLKAARLTIPRYQIFQECRPWLSNERSAYKFASHNVFLPYRYHNHKLTLRGLMLIENVFSVGTKRTSAH